VQRARAGRGGLQIVISAKARNIGAGPYDDFLQTDAAINPGNSGGPLFDMSGSVVGMNTAIVGGGTGVGFAVPANIIQALLPQLEKGEAVRRGWLGVVAQDLTPDLGRALGVAASSGAVIADVMAGSPAAAAGLRRDDVVTAVDGKPVGTANALTRSVAFQSPGSTVTLHVARGREALDAKVKLGTAPAPKQPVAAREDRAERAEPGRLGLAVQDVPPEVSRAEGIPASGALVVRVQPGTPADAAGLAAGMVIVEAGGRRVEKARDLAAALESARPDSVVLLRVQAGPAQVVRALRIPRTGLTASSGQ
jgi:serine protease Do